MDRIDKLFSAFLGGALMPAFEFFYGSGEIVKYTITALIFFIAMDWITGIRAAKKDASYASKYGIDGIFRTFFILLLPAGGHLLDLVLSAPAVLFGLISFGVLYHVIQSMTANAIRAGWGQWFPEWLMTKLSEWVRSEIEVKLQRSEKRREEREGRSLW